MKGFNFFCGIVLIFFQLAGSKNLAYPTSQAISEVVSKLFIENQLKFDVLLYGTQTPKLKLISDEFLKFNILPVKIETINESQWDFKLYKSAIILLENQKNLKSLLENAELSNFFPAELKFLVYVEENFELKIPKNLERKIYVGKNRGQLFHYAFFLEENSNFIKLRTAELFTEKLCNQTQILTLNIFNKTSRKWKQNLEIPAKFQNFHNCTIICGVIVNSAQSYENPVTLKIEGIVPGFMRAVAKKLNFSLFLQEGDFAKPKKKAPRKVIHPHIIPSVMSTMQFYYHLTTTFDDEVNIFVITPAEKFSSYEKLLLPFDNETWTYLMIVFGVAFLTVFVVNRMEKKVQNLFYGEKVRMPSYNIAGSFFGISQVREPEGDFARILLIYFVIFCLIFRTAYQGVFFKMMTTDMRKKLPQTIRNLYEQNFTIIYNSDFTYTERELTSMIDKSERPLLSGQNFTKFNETFSTLIKSSSPKLAFYMTEKDYEILTKMYFRVEGIKLKETFFSSPIGLIFPRNHFLYKKSDETIQWLTSAGITRKLWREIDFLKPIPKDVKKPEILTVEDLRFGFTIWLVACGVSSFAFVGKILYFVVKKNLKKMLRESVGLILLFRLLKWKVENQ